MRVVRDGITVHSGDDEKTDDSAMPRTERDGELIHSGEAKSVVAPPEDKAVKSAPEKKAH